MGRIVKVLSVGLVNDYWDIQFNVMQLRQHDAKRIKNNAHKFKHQSTTEH